MFIPFCSILCLMNVFQTRLDRSLETGALGLLGAALLLGSLWVLSLLGGGLGPDRVSDAYYISSSSYVVQTSRDASGAVQSRVDENSGVWTNIPGIRGGDLKQKACKGSRKQGENKEKHAVFLLF